MKISGTSTSSCAANAEHFTDEGKVERGSFGVLFCVDPEVPGEGLCTQTCAREQRGELSAVQLLEPVTSRLPMGTSLSPDSPVADVSLLSLMMCVRILFGSGPKGEIPFVCPEALSFLKAEQLLPPCRASTLLLQVLVNATNTSEKSSVPN